MFEWKHTSQSYITVSLFHRATTRQSLTVLAVGWLVDLVGDISRFYATKTTDSLQFSMCLIQNQIQQINTHYKKNYNLDLSFLISSEKTFSIASSFLFHFVKIFTLRQDPLKITCD